MKLAWTLLATLVIAPTASLADGDFTRQVSIRSARLTPDGALTLGVSVTELSDGIPYPMTTLDRTMFEIIPGHAPSSPYSVDSLGTTKTITPQPDRALVTIITNTTPINATDLPTHTALAEILPEWRPSFLAVFRGPRSESDAPLIESTPTQSEAPHTLQRMLLNMPAAFSGGDLAESVCAAARTFDRWATDNPTTLQQRTLIVLGQTPPASSVTLPRLESCVQSLEERSVRVFALEQPPALGSRVPTFSSREISTRLGGYAQPVKSPHDAFRALSNALSNINDEYILETRLPRFPTGLEVLALTVRVNYHGDKVESARQQLSVPSELRSSDTTGAQAWYTQREFWIFVLCCLATIAAVWVGVKLTLARLRYLRATHICSTCNQRVKRDDSDCPFRRPDVIARLVVISGPQAGMVFPLFPGPNKVGKSRSCRAPISDEPTARRHHATIEIQSGRALYRPRRATARDPRLHAINGWPILEPRLLGTGSVIRIGQTFLRFEGGRVE